MRSRIYLIVGLAAVATNLQAAPPLPIDLPLLIPAEANFGPGCNLGVRIPRGADFPIHYSTQSGHGGSTIMLEELPRRFRVGHLYLGLVCYDAKADDLNPDDPVRFDSERNEWVRDIDKEIKRWGGDRLDSNAVQAMKKSIRVYPLKNSNSQGYAYAVEPWTGDESKRTRTLDYCLFHSAIALCGHGETGLLRDGPKGDLTPYVLEILRSVEFLDDNSMNPSEAASAAAAAKNH